jgi:multidrug transporter EmrE-like cation transporter
MALYAGIGLLGLLGAISDATLNQWAQTNRHLWLAASYGLWLAVATLFGFLLKQDRLDFAPLVVLFLVANSAFAVVLDRIWFDGTVSSRQWIGLVLALGAVVLLEFGRGSSTA